MEENAKTGSGLGKKISKVLLRILYVLLITVLLILLLAYSALFIVCRGPSESARNLFVLSVRETSAVGFLADIFLSEEEIAAIEARPSDNLSSTDTSLIAFSEGREEDGPFTDDWGYTDDDGDGIIIVPVVGESYVGKMMIVLDPSRVVLGCSPDTLGYKGHTVDEYVEIYDAVAAINGGGFVDPNGTGNGSMPNTLIVSGGKIYCGSNGVGHGFVGIDDEYILHVGFSSSQDVKDWNIQEGTGYGPVLVINGEALDPEELVSGLNPRTAIGQRSDGAILMLVIEGRQATSLGASYQDLAEIMLKFGAVNAANLDGGSSSLMWYQGGYINNSASIIGIRDIPTSFVVLKEGARTNG